MTQVHCEIKTDIYNEFDKAGVQTHVQEIDPSFNNNQGKYLLIFISFFIIKIYIINQKIINFKEK